jgi:hypothetical protein
MLTECASTGNVRATNQYNMLTECASAGTVTATKQYNMFIACSYAGNIRATKQSIHMVVQGKKQVEVERLQLYITTCVKIVNKFTEHTKKIHHKYLNFICN